MGRGEVPLRVLLAQGEAATVVGKLGANVARLRPAFFKFVLGEGGQSQSGWLISVDFLGILKHGQLVDYTSLRTIIRRNGMTWRD